MPVAEWFLVELVPRTDRPPGDGHPRGVTLRVWGIVGCRIGSPSPGIKPGAYAYSLGKPRSTGVPKAAERSEKRQRALDPR